MSTRTLDAAALGERPVGRLLWHACTQTTIAVGVYGIYALTNAWFVARGVGTTAMVVCVQACHSSRPTGRSPRAAVSSVRALTAR